MWIETIGVVTLTLLLSSAGTSQAPAAPQPGITKARTEKGLYLLKIVEPLYDVTVTETERRPQSSVLEMNGVVPTVTANGTVLFRAIYDIAKERGFEYVFILYPPKGSRPPPRPRQSNGWLVSDVLTVFMTKDPKTPLKELLGTDYSAEAQQLFEAQRGYLSMPMFAVLFGGK